MWYQNNGTLMDIFGWKINKTKIKPLENVKKMQMGNNAIPVILTLS